MHWQEAEVYSAHIFLESLHKPLRRPHPSYSGNSITYDRRPASK